MLYGNGKSGNDDNDDFTYQNMPRTIVFSIINKASFHTPVYTYIFSVISQVYIHFIDRDILPTNNTAHTKGTTFTDRHAFLT